VKGLEASPAGRSSVKIASELSMQQSLEVWTSSNPVDVGWCAVRIVAVGGGNFRPGLTGWGREVTVKVCGVAVTMPQGQSRVPTSSTGMQ
jgi:hypothetical protein